VPNARCCETATSSCLRTRSATQGRDGAGATVIFLSRLIHTLRRGRLARAGRLAATGSLVLAALAAPSYAALRTTQPGSTLRVYVTLSDKGIRYAAFDVLQTGGQVGLVPARGGGTRGEVAIFTVKNTGKKAHDFALLGKKTPALRPGRKSVFSVVLLRRGSFPFQSTIDKGNPGFRGVFVVR